jgi:hypothetical protein
MDKYLARDMSNRDFIIEIVLNVIIALAILIGTENWFYLFCFYAYSRIHYRFNVNKSRQLEILSEIQKIKDRLEIDD